MTAPPPPRFVPPSEDDILHVSPPAGDDTDDLPEGVAAGLRTAAGPGRIDPVPVVVIGGTDVASSVSGTAPVALDDFSVRWGRDGAFDQPTPATAAVALWDPTGRWAIGRDLIGQTLDLAWTATKPGAGPARQVFFRGRITAVKPQRRSLMDTRGGALVQLTASSVLTDLGNRVPTEAWPHETLSARAARILPYLPATTVASITQNATWVSSAYMAPVAGTEQSSLLESIAALYNSINAARMTYLPDTSQVRFINRRRLLARAPGMLWWNKTGDNTARDNKGIYARPRSITESNGGMDWLPHYLHAGAEVEDAEDVLSKDITARITRVEVSHPDANGSPAYTAHTETALVAGTTEGAQGVRSIRHDSQVAFNDWAQSAANDLADMAAQEGSGWAIDTLTWRVDLAGGFEYFDQFAELALRGGEVQSLVFLQGSWLAAWDIRPIFGVIGGTITYRGGWRLEMRFLPFSTFDTPAHAITWEEIDDGSSTYEVQWWDSDHTKGMHESLTYEDLAFVGIGLNVPATPADSGFDRRYSQ